MLGFLYVFHIPIDELTKKLRFLAITVLRLPLGQAGYHLARIAIFFFHSPIDELTNKLRVRAITVLHSLLGQAGYPLARILECFLHSYQ